MKNKKIAFDILLNIIAVAIPIAILQLIIFPLLAKKEGEEVYGYIVTLLSLIAIGAESIGNSLNNTRLLQEEKYKEESIKGDFNRMVLYGIIADTVFVFAGLIYYRSEGGIPVLVIVASILILMRSYYIVAYRIDLNYKNILINNAILGIGYLLGYLAYTVVGRWEVIYILANIISLVHLFFSTNIMKEPLVITALFKDSAKCFGAIYAADIVKTFMTYADRLLIYPILGATSVAYYYTASVMGKMISMVVTPVSSVMLSYVVKEKTPKESRYHKVLFIMLGCAIPVALAGLFASDILIRFLYKEMYDSVVGLLIWTVTGSVISAITSMLLPLVLRYLGAKYQLYINIFTLFIYVICSLGGALIWGLVGFCIAFLISMILKLLVYIFFLERFYRRNRQINKLQ